MNALKVGTPASISAGSSPIGSSCWPLTTAHSPKSIGDSPSVRERNSSSPRSSERAPASLMPGSGVVEGQDRRGAAARGGRGVLPKPIGMLGVGQPKVGVHVDDAGEHEHAAGLHDAGAVRRQTRSDGLDPAVAHGHVTGLRAARRSRRCRRGSRGRPAQAPSLISISWAPSHSTRRPTSRNRSSQPSSGISVAKWLPASGPTRELKLQAPYGKRISHSLISPV